MEVEKSNSWQAGGGTTALGIIGTALGGLATVAGGGALLGGGMNGNNSKSVQNENMELKSRIAQLQSEKYTDSHILDMSKELSAVDEHLHAVDQRLELAITKNTADIAYAKDLLTKDLEIARQQTEISALQTASQLNARIDAVAAAATQGIQANSGAIANLQTLVSGITRTAVPQSAVCSFNSCGCCSQAQQ